MSTAAGTDDSPWPQAQSAGEDDPAATSAGPQRKQRTRLSPAERKKQLLSHGLAWIEHRPLDTITVEDLAAAANVSPGLVFYYFDSRQGLHKAILRAAGTLFLSAFEPSLDLPAHERARDAISRTVAFVREHGETFASIARSATSPDEDLRAINAFIRDQSARYTRRMLDELGLPDSPIVDLSIHAWLVVVEQTLLASQSTLPDDEVVDFLTRTLFAMINVPTAR